MNENTSNEELKFPLGKELKIEDIEYPEEIDKNFMQIADNKVIINTLGGEFFPDKYAVILQISIFPSIVLLFFVYGFIFLKFCKIIHPFIFIIIFFIHLVISLLLFSNMSKLTSIKTTFIFNLDGINIQSKKGSLFIPKDNIENIKVRETEDKYNRGMIKYDIIFEFKNLIYIPYIKEYKDTAAFLSDVYCLEETVGRNQVKFFVYYILQEIKKALNM